MKRDTYRIEERVNQAKRTMLDALKIAESEGHTKAIIRQLEVLTGKLEQFENSKHFAK